MKSVITEGEGTDLFFWADLFFHLDVEQHSTQSKDLSVQGGDAVLKGNTVICFWKIECYGLRTVMRILPSFIVADRLLRTLEGTPNPSKRLPDCLKLMQRHLYRDDFDEVWRGDRHSK